MTSPSSSATAPTTRSAGASCSPTRRSRTSAPPTRRRSARSRDSFAHWDDIDVHVHGRAITSSGHGFAGSRASSCCSILQERAARARRDARASRPSRRRARPRALGLGDADLIVAADGVNSAMRARARRRTSSPTSTCASARYIWLGTTFPFDAFTFYFVENEHGVFQAHCYRFDERRSTFIVECDERSWRNAGFDRLDLDGNRSRPASALFAPVARRAPPDVQRAPPARPPWTTFVRVRNESLVPRQRRPHRRRRAHGALLDRIGHQAGDGGRDRAGARSRLAADPPTRRWRATRTSA